MEVILLEKVGKLGTVGDIVRVKGGFARNFLIPRNKALRATEINKELFEQKKLYIEQQNSNSKQAAEEISAKIQDVTVDIIRQASDDGKLFGSVTARDIAAALIEKGLPITKHNVIINTAIKFIGIYTITISLHPELEETVTINIKRPEVNILS